MSIALLICFFYPIPSFVMEILEWRYGSPLGDLLYQRMSYSLYLVGAHVKADNLTRQREFLLEFLSLDHYLSSRFNNQTVWKR